jgi:phosphohistidine swiveling domain-containing protein
MTDQQKQVLEFIKNTKEWRVPVYRPNNFIFDSILRAGHRPKLLSKALGKDVIINEVTVAGNLYSSKQSFDDVTNYIFELIDNKKSKNLFEFGKRCEKAGQELLDVVKGANRDDIVKNLLKYRDAFAYNASFLLTIVYADKALQYKVEELIKQKVGKADVDILKNITYVRKFNTSTEETINLLKLTQKIKENNWNVNSTEAKKLIKDHTNKYKWLSVRNYLVPDFTYNNFEDRVVNLLQDNPQEELDSVYQARDDAEKATQGFIKQYKLTKYEIDLIDVVKEFVWLRTYRTEAMYSSRSFVRPILQEAADKLKINLDDILYLSIEEIVEKLEGNSIDLLVIDERKKGYYLASYNGQTAWFVGDDRKLIDDLNVFTRHLNFDKNIKQIKGNPAHKGKVTGPAKIVLEMEDISKVNKGDILVAVMTFPNFIPAMEKAAAFVTDEGGILCHAAIVSREMNKPCVIATKHATKILQDGDMIEVDGDNGIIKKI